MMRRAWIAALVLVAVGVLTLTQCKPHPQSQPSPATTTTVYSWMRCQECTLRERARVVALGDSAVPLLRTLLLDGPPSGDVDHVRRYLDGLKTPLSGGGWQPPTQASLDESLEDYVSNYRIRAANALGAIRTANAQSAVCEAKRRNFARPGVREAIDDALAHMSGTCP